MIDQIIYYAGLFFIVIGSIFLFLGALGIYRMPDLYNRLQAGTKATTLGGMGLVLGVGLLQPDWFVKAIMLIIFIALSNPISSHALARGAYKSGIKPFLKGGDEYDTYKDVTINENKEDA
jgi:multicomponent Na+:H+ antiporter subunit G